MKKPTSLLWLLLSVLPWVVIRSQSPAPDQVCLMVPPDVEECYKSFQGKPITARAAQIYCLQKLLWNFVPDDNLTSHDIDYFKHLIGYPGPEAGGFRPSTPPSGHRIRKEYRTLTAAERKRFHDALQQMYQDGVIRLFARLNAKAAAVHYGGPSFLPWHRVYIALFEEALRQYDPSVSLPFWDSTMDDDMDNPVNSVIWSHDYFGNGAGDVMTGPFSGWVTNQGNLERQYGRHSRLLSLEMIRDILSQCTLETISSPSGPPRSNLEFLQSGVNLWVGGDMSSPVTAGFDPVFYMHLAFVDYVWELYRRHQSSDCGVDPTTDYPDVSANSTHALSSPMLGYDWLTNQEGLQQYWTGSWYRYESAPTCPDCCPNCSTPTPIYCEDRKLLCLARSRRQFPFDVRTATNSMLAQTERHLDPSEINALERTYPTRNRVLTIVGPPNDGRTLFTAVVDAILANREDLATTDIRTVDPRGRQRGTGDAFEVIGGPGPSEQLSGTQDSMFTSAVPPNLNSPPRDPGPAVVTVVTDLFSQDRPADARQAGFDQPGDIADPNRGSQRQGGGFQRGGGVRAAGMGQFDQMGNMDRAIDSSRGAMRGMQGMGQGGPIRDSRMDGIGDASLRGGGGGGSGIGGGGVGGVGMRPIRDDFGQIGPGRDQMREEFRQRGGDGRRGGDVGRVAGGQEQILDGFRQGGFDTRVMRDSGGQAMRSVDGVGQGTPQRGSFRGSAQEGMPRTRGPGEQPGRGEFDPRLGFDPRTGVGMLGQSQAPQVALSQGFQQGPAGFDRRQQASMRDMSEVGSRRDFGPRPAVGPSPPSGASDTRQPMRRQQFDRQGFDRRQSLGSRQ